MSERGKNIGARVVVAMSGGVDSSLAAALLVEAGYDVVGVSMRLWTGPGTSSGCCSLDDFLDARRVAEQLGIPFYVMDFGAEFQRAVVDDFVAEYRNGRTPNPCVRCNQFVKFASFWTRARELGADFVATGHYARTRAGANGSELLRGIDPDKDQSYFLFSIAADVLERTLFPVGELTKTAVRDEAERRGLPVARKADSQEICFVAPGMHAEFVESYESPVPVQPGRVIDRDGRVVAQHGGVHRFTIGQRRGLGGGGGVAPQYVNEIDARDGTVRIGPDETVVSDGLVAMQSHWLGTPPTIGAQLQVKIRSRFAAQTALVTAVDGSRFSVLVPAGLRAVTPGQAAVLYDGERVVGGGWIERALRSGQSASTRSAAAVAE